MLNKNLFAQIKELAKKHGFNEEDFLITIEMVEQTPEERRTIADIEEDLKNGEMIDLPMCNIRDIKQGCFGCQYLKSDGTCSRK